MDSSGLEHHRGMITGRMSLPILMNSFASKPYAQLAAKKYLMMSKSSLRKIKIKKEIRKKQTLLNNRRASINKIVYGDRKAKRRSLHLLYG